MKTWLSSICFLLFWGLLPLWSQEHNGLQQKKDELENRKKRLQQEINDYNKQLEATKKNKRLSINQLLQLNRKIEKRQELIGTINKELQFTGQAIDRNITDINNLHGQLKALKSQYARMISSTYLMRYGNSTWTFLLSAKDINQSVKRAAWMKQLSDDRLMHARLIQEKTDTLAIKVKSLEERRLTQSELLSEKEKEKEVLDKEKDLQQENLTRLQKKEKDIKRQIRKKQEEANKLNLAIMKMIDDEIRKARKEVAAASKKAEKKKGKNKNKKENAADKKNASTDEETPTENRKTTIELLNISPEAQQLSEHFESNRNRLPWPVVSGSVIGSFGEHDHPLLKGIKIKNNGINIVTGRDSRIRAVFDGEITGVVSIPGAGKAVIIRHGEYLTVYGNLNEVYVSKGDKVKSKQNLGMAMANEENKPELHFEVWRGTSTLNPENWLINK